MKKAVINILKCVIFLALLGGSLLFINSILMPKYSYSDSEWPTTSTFKGFYDMKPGSVDVIFLGSSVAASAYDPQVIYDHNNIRSYSLASEQQSLFLSYYWLKEAMNYQSPKAVAVDLKFLFTTHPESPINTSEPITRKALDPMKNTVVKKDAVNELCALDPSQTTLSYYLTNIRFHSRWTDLNALDFAPAEYTYSPLKGFAPLSDKGPKEFNPMERGKTGDCAPCNEFMLSCLDRIAELCRSKNCALILTYMAEDNFNEKYHNTMQKYADERGLNLYDFSDSELYDKVGAQLRKECIVEHANFWGAEKLSRFMADELQEVYGIKGQKDDQWETSRAFHEHVAKTCELSDLDDMAQFLDAINDENYTTLIAVRNDASRLADEALAKGLQKLGLSDIRNFENESYIAVISPGNAPFELNSTDPISHTGAFDSGSVYSITSAGFTAGNSCSVTVDGREYGNGEMGLHLVIYDNLLKKVVEVRDL